MLLFIPDLFRRVEMPNQYCLALLELNGIGFSTVECETQKNVMQAKLNEIENRIYQLAGHSFSLTCPDDIAEVLKGTGWWEFSPSGWNVQIPVGKLL